MPASVTEVTAILAIILSACSLALSLVVFRNQRHRELWWAVVEDEGVQKGVAVTFRTHRYIGKTRPNRREHPNATIIRGYVLSRESDIGRERMGTLAAMKHMAKRRWADGEADPDVPDDVHPPKITMVPLRVIRYGPRNPRHSRI